jgi:hypothetical protein
MAMFRRAPKANCLIASLPTFEYAAVDVNCDNFAVNPVPRQNFIPES